MAGIEPTGRDFGDHADPRSHRHKMFSGSGNQPFQGTKPKSARNEKPPCPAGPRGGFRCCDARTSHSGSRERPVPPVHDTTEVAHDREPVKAPMTASHRAHDFLHSARVADIRSVRGARGGVNVFVFRGIANPAGRPGWDRPRREPSVLSLPRAVSSTGRAKDF